MRPARLLALAALPCALAFSACGSTTPRVTETVVTQVTVTVPPAETSAPAVPAADPSTPMASDSPPSSEPPPADEPAGASETPSGDAALVVVLGVVDGDTIRVRVDGRDQRVRVIGIDTPELGDCAFQPATSAMEGLLASGQVRLEADPTQASVDRHGRLLRHVFTSEGVNVAQTLIAGGYGIELTYAEPYPLQSAYRAAQASARRGGLGIWARNACPTALLAGSHAAPRPVATTTRPPTSRAPLVARPTASPRPTSAPRPTTTAPRPAAPRPTTTAPRPVARPTSGGCTIKGNINDEGEKIYHVPGQRYYNKTQISLAKGERWFCSAAEAERAGWRPAKV